MNTYMPCPNGCTGEVPMGIEVDGADPSVGQFSPALHTYVDDNANAESHDDGCSPLTEAQVFALQEEADDKVNDPDYGYWDQEP